MDPRHDDDSLVEFIHCLTKRADEGPHNKKDDITNANGDRHFWIGAQHPEKQRQGTPTMRATPFVGLENR
jgi:hypothetical protein